MPLLQRILLSGCCLLSLLLCPPASAGIRLFPHEREPLDAAPSSACCLFGRGVGATEEVARAKALEAIALQLEATVHSALETRADERLTSRDAVWSEQSRKVLRVGTELREQAGLSFDSRERRGQWMVVARLDRAEAMRALYRRDYQPASAELRVAAEAALASQDEPPRFTPAWRKAVALYSPLVESAAAIELLAAGEARQKAPVVDGTRAESLEALRAVETRATGTAPESDGRASVHAQRGLLETLEQDRALYSSLLAAGESVWKRNILGVRAEEEQKGEGERVASVKSPYEEALTEAAAGLAKRGMRVDQGAVTPVILRLVTGPESIVGSAQKESPVSCELRIRMRLEFADGTRIPMGSEERVVSRHRSDPGRACLAAARLVTSESNWLDQQVALLCTVLPCEAALGR